MYFNANSIASLAPHQRRAYLDSLSPKEVFELAYDWKMWARPEQRPPDDDAWQFFLYLAGRGAGKALDLDTPIPCPSGWTTMGEIKVGDVLFDETGKLCMVTAVFDVPKPETAYRLVFSDRTTMVACGDHQWHTWTANERCLFSIEAALNTSRLTQANFDWPTWRSADGQGPRVRTTQQIVDSLADQHSIPPLGRFDVPMNMAAMTFELAEHWLASHWRIHEAWRVSPRPMRCITVDSPNSLFLAGRAMIPTHNTRSGAEWVREQVEKKGRKLIHLVAPTAADYRDVMVNGNSGIISVSRPDFMPIFEPSNRRVLWPNGAQALCFSAAEPERLRGPQCEAAWCDELCAWGRQERGKTGGKNRRQQDTWDMLMFGLRLGTNPQVFISTTPKTSVLLKKLMKDPLCVIQRGSTYDNRANLADSFFENVIKTYEGSRLGRQELNAEVLDDLAGALWTLDMMDAVRIPRTHEAFPELKRIVVAIDPSGSDAETGSQQGIVVAGQDNNGLFYVLDDRSVSDTPQGWACAVVQAYHDWSADMIVAERNFGGDMVKAIIQGQDRNVPIKMVTASQGKHVRAEPIASLYEQGRVRHFGYFPQLEEQMNNFTHEGYQGSGSPDRVDACLVGETLILTEEGRKLLVEVKVGDRVLTRGGYQRVAWSGKTREGAACFDIDFSDGTRITATSEHPFFVIGCDTFLAVAHLKVGDEVFTRRHLDASGFCPSVSVTRIQPHAGVADVYNLHVENHHEFFAEGVLVHNCVWALTELAYPTKRIGVVMGARY